jgi:Uma2 family endonuclease
MEFVLRNFSLPAYLRLPRPMNDQEFLRLCVINSELRIEQEENGEILVMSPVGLRGGAVEQAVGSQLSQWANTNGRGMTFSPSTGFRLPNGLVKMADASWVSFERLNALTAEQREGIPTLCPEFVIEILSKTDSIAKLVAKMEMWIANGAQLAWMIEPERPRITVFRRGEDPEIHDAPTSVNGTGPVAGFVLKLDPSAMGQF